MLTEKRKEELIHLLQEMVQAKSVSGKEEEVVKKIAKAMGQLGFDDHFIDAYGSLIGVIRGKNKGKKILFDGHIDTVPVPDPKAWTYPPFEGVIKDGKLYGRGTSDMKGQTAAMITASAWFAKDYQKEFDGEIYVACVVFEEIFEGVAARKISEKVKPDYVVIGESSEMNLKIGQRGRAEIVIESFGKPAHSANPEKGIHAVYKMSRLIDRIQQMKTPEHEVLGKGILVLTDIKSSPYPGASVVPDYCKATFDRRLLVGETKESVMEPIQGLIEEMMMEDPEMKFKASFAHASETCYTGSVIEGERFFPAWLYDKEDEFVKKAYKGLQHAGLSPAITEYSFCTNGSHYAGEAGIKTIGFGPSLENLAHTIDEHILIESLYLGCEGYYGILQSVFNKI